MATRHPFPCRYRRDSLTLSPASDSRGTRLASLPIRKPACRLREGSLERFHLTLKRSKIDGARETMDVGERAETSGGKAVTPERKEKFPIGEMGRATMPLKADGRNDLTSRMQVQTGLIVVWRKEIICGAADYEACMAAGLEPQYLPARRSRPVGIRTDSGREIHQMAHALEDILGLPTLGSIPEVPERRRARRLCKFAQTPDSRGNREDSGGHSKKERGVQAVNRTRKTGVPHRGPGCARCRRGPPHQHVGR